MGNTQTKRDFFYNWLLEKYGDQSRNFASLEAIRDHNADFYWQSFAEFSEVISNKNQPSESGNSNLSDLSITNYAEYIFQKKTAERAALLFATETVPAFEISWSELENQTASFADYLQWAGIKSGDTVLGITEDVPEALQAFLACAALGAVWYPLHPTLSSWKLKKIIKKVNPALLIASESFHYQSIVEKINDLDFNSNGDKHLIVLPAINQSAKSEKVKNGKYWNDTFNMDAPPLQFQNLAWNAPLLGKVETSFFGTSVTHFSHSQLLLSSLHYLNIESTVENQPPIFSPQNLGLPLLIGATQFLFAGDQAHTNFSKQNAVIMPEIDFDLGLI